LAINSTEIQLDAATGSIRIGAFTPTISGELQQHAFEDGYQNAISGSRGMGNGYVWIGLGNKVTAITLDGALAGLSLCFFEGRLESVSFGVELPSDVFESNWPTQETSLRQAAFLRESLGKKLGRKILRSGSSFPWGDVWASFDEKGFCASAGLRYKWAVLRHEALNKARARVWT
jgi:hypothetical protein